ncbi:protein shisa-5-like [Heptranchias perlo]|uniref:protein shisa-5-like n=1 Tax=Heptranchias perlo TaxID=212740 RepID=UPI003559F745
MEKLGLRIARLVVVCVAILPVVSAYDIECSLGFSGVSCRENNTTQKILIGVGVVVFIIVVGAILSCCCCGCCACCRSEPPRPTVVTTSATTMMPVSCPQQMPAYPAYQGYQPVPLQLSSAQLAMATAPYPNQYAMAHPNHGQPPSYHDIASSGQPLHRPAQQPLCTSVAIPGDNPAFVDPVKPYM